MSEAVNRRQFVGAAAGLAAGAVTLAAEGNRAAVGNAAPLVVGVMGMGGRGRSLAKSFAERAGVTVAYVCDPDSDRREAGAAEVEKIASKRPEAVADFRRILDDKNVDILVNAACNHWHAPAAIQACLAGKHVYVEKPCSHTPHEGELLVEAARREKRHVQMGNQRRSWPAYVEAIQRIHEGAIGRAYYAKCFYRANRPALHLGEPTDPPANLDYTLWQGPCTPKPYRPEMLHYNWHWQWHWGNGELGNNGIHHIDVCRWALGAKLPNRVAALGGRYQFEDDQETPDTMLATFDFPNGTTICWEGISCVREPDAIPNVELIVYGENGSVMFTGGGYSVHDAKGKLINKSTGRGGDADHLDNFLATVRGEGALNSEIAEGAASTLLCHLGNIAYRTSSTLKCDPETGHILDNPKAAEFWDKEYAPGWRPKV